ncbi:MAG TPA: DUF3455 domain-containing protein [Steroidobacteraceae bacterium]
MNYQSRGALLRTLLLAATLLVVTIVLSAARLFAQVPQVSSPELVSGQVQSEQVPSEIVVPGQVATAILHAEGTEIYQCETDNHKQLAWRPREPVATLILDGETVGWQYAGLRWGHIDESKLRWEYVDGSEVKARIVASAPGASPDDIPWLRLDVISQTGNGALYGVTAVQRINTRGGMAQGPCERAGSYLNVPFSATYVFWRED